MDIIFPLANWNSEKLDNFLQSAYPVSSRAWIGTQVHLTPESCFEFHVNCLAHVRKSQGHLVQPMLFGLPGKPEPWNRAGWYGKNKEGKWAHLTRAHTHSNAHRLQQQRQHERRVLTKPRILWHWDSPCKNLAEGHDQECNRQTGMFSKALFTLGENLGFNLRVPQWEKGDRSYATPTLWNVL